MKLNRRLSVFSLHSRISKFWRIWILRKCSYTDRGFELARWCPCDLEIVFRKRFTFPENSVYWKPSTVTVEKQSALPQFLNPHTSLNGCVECPFMDVLWECVQWSIQWYLFKGKLSFRRSPLPVSRWGNTGILECATFISFCLSVALGVFCISNIYCFCRNI